MAEVLVAAALLAVILGAIIKIASTAFQARSLTGSLKVAEEVFSNVRMVVASPKLCGEILAPSAPGAAAEGAFRASGTAGSSIRAKINLTVPLSSPNFDRIESHGTVFVQKGAVIGNRITVTDLSIEGHLPALLLTERGPSGEELYRVPAMVRVVLSSAPGNASSSMPALVRNIPTQLIVMKLGPDNFEIRSCHVQDFRFEQRMGAVLLGASIAPSGGAGLADRNDPALSDQDVKETFFNSSTATRLRGGCRNELGWQLSTCSRAGAGVDVSVNLARDTSGNIYCEVPSEADVQLRLSCMRVSP
jgi:hypothetical protein